MGYCAWHDVDFNSFCVDCMVTKTGAGTTDSYYPPGSSKDMVNSPSHYTQGGIETIDYIKAKLTPEEFKGYLKGNIIKYTSRAGLKDEVAQEFKKAQWYIQRMIDELDSK
jgi:hypothetical protein